MLREQRGKNPDKAKSCSFKTRTDHAAMTTGHRKEMSVQVLAVCEETNIFTENVFVLLV